MKTDKWVQRWKVNGSNEKVWIVAIDAAGNYGCSCPVWKFKRQECHHITAIKNQPAGMKEVRFRDAFPGNVGEVTVKNDGVLYPLVPIGLSYSTHLAATIVYDLQRANVCPEQIKDYRNRMLKGNSFKAITEYIVEYGRLIYTQFKTDQGWINPTAIHYDTPLKSN